MKTWQQFLLEKAEHEFSSTQVNLPGSIASKIRHWGHQFVSDSDVDPEEGREDEVHVTVLFGLHDNEPDDVEAALEGEGPIKLTLGKTSIFECDKYDVVKLDVNSEDLHRLNAKLRDHCEHTQTHPQYKPHCTIAYVKKGVGKKYIGSDKFAGTKLEIDEVLFSNKSRVKTAIRLGIVA